MASENSYDKKTHLEFIQHVIERMARNSLSCKQFALTLFSALSAVFLSTGKISYGKSTTSMFWGTTFIMLIVFWALDSWYLRMERKFRRLYDKVRLEEGELSSPYDMSIADFEDEQRVLRIMFSRSTCPVYTPLVAVVLYCFCRYCSL